MFLDSLPLSLPSPSSFLLITVIILPLSFTLYALYQQYLSPLSPIPGPFWASLSRTWLATHVLHRDLLHVTPALHAKYGKFVRIAPDEISVSDARAIKTIYGTNTGFTKTEFYSSMAPPSKTPLGGMFSQRDEALHARRKRIVSPIYTMTNVLKSEGYVDKCTGEFMGVLGRYAESGEAMDLGGWLKRYAFDVIGELFYGADFGFLKGLPETEGLIDSAFHRGAYLSLLASMPLLYKLLPLLSAIPSIKAGAIRLRALYIKAQSLVDARVGQKSDRTDMLSQLFAIQTHNPDYTTSELYLESFDAIGAGSSTTATAMQSILYHIMKNPPVYAKLVSEIDSAASSDLLSNPIKYSEAIKLPYLVAVCKEGMRMFPSVGMTLPRHVPKGGSLIAGKFFAEGTRVGVNAFVSHFDKDVFGHDVEIFNPERWLREGAREMDGYMFQFGAGSRSCIGKNVSLLEIHKLVPQILREFKISLVNPKKEWRTRTTWFASASGVDIVVKPRKSESS